MLLAHVPAAIATSVCASFHLDGTKAVTDFIGNDNIAVWDARRGKSGNKTSSQELAHDKMLACRTSQAGVTNATHNHFQRQKRNSSSPVIAPHNPATIQNPSPFSTHGMPPTLMPINPVRKPSGRKMPATMVSI